jgi:hypothetical protein
MEITKTWWDGIAIDYDSHRKFAALQKWIYRKREPSQLFKKINIYV